VSDVAPAGVPPLARIVHTVAHHQPRLYDGRDRWQAATSLVLHDDPGRGPEVLFIERAARPGDRWSGQMALPGGKREPQDRDLLTTAMRETHEEVGVVLPAPIGRLDDVPGRTLSGTVATFVFTIDARPDLVIETSEVAEAVWIPLASLLEPTAAVRHRYGIVGVFPGLRYERFTVWGLTLGILEHFADVIGARLPHR
jgi:8-oxo-dGTP pyrophosphatase MutT (NUDIX family)